MLPPAGPVLLFDGVCSLCDRAVQVVLDHEPAGRIQFASLQSEIGRKLLADHGIDADDTDSVVFVDRGRAYVRSDAALQVAARLDAPWKWLVVGRLVSRPVRDRVYDYVARNRYRWFGTRDACRLPTPQTRARFLDAGETATPPASAISPPPAARQT